VYHDWQQLLPAGVQLCAVQLPGRGARMREATIDNIQELVTKLADAIAPYLDKPFAFFGHSMGAAVAFELCRRLRAMNKPLPQHLLVSACRAPHIPLQRAPIHGLTKTEFWRAIDQLNGTPKELLDNAELRDMLEPTLRADLKLIETRQYSEQAPLPVPITAFGGAHDQGASPDMLQAWQEHSSSGFWMRLFPGGHFYHNEHKQLLLKQISELLYINPRIAM
jgi:medium-chain acyl-[acyl-carrier-protein] hydrolase